MDAHGGLTVACADEPLIDRKWADRRGEVAQLPLQSATGRSTASCTNV
jgi:hypothetical protein